MRRRGALAFAIQSVPIKYLSSHQYIGSTIGTQEIPPYDPVRTYGMTVSKPEQFASVMGRHIGTLESRYHIKEDDLGIAATTPVLGQYVPTFGWPDDWGWYWEYLDARLFVPEASFAAKFKTRMIWKSGWEIDCADSTRKALIERNIRRTRIIPRLIYGTHNAIVWGNNYQEIVGNSRATWGAGQSEVDYALSSTGLIYGLPRPLLSFRPTTQFYGLKTLDPRTVRIEIHPQEFDLANGEVYRSKYIQRRWAGPLAPTQAYPQSQQVELDFHPSQMFCLQFNRLPDVIYGYSIYRETLYALKGYMLMVQFLPTIFQHRADPLLVFKFGGNVKLPSNVEVTEVPSDDDIEMEKERFIARQPGDDIYGKVTMTVEEVFKSARNSADLVEFLRTYKERILMGMGIPLSIAISETGQEIKWGSMKYEVSEDEVKLDYQMVIAEEVDRKLMRLLGGTEEDHFRFRDVRPEEQRADEVPIADLYQRGLITREYANKHLKLPEEALQGTFIYDTPIGQSMLKPPGQEQNGSNGERNSKYRVRDTSEGYIIEAVDDLNEAGENWKRTRWNRD